MAGAMTELTMDVVGAALFGHQFGDMARRMQKVVTTGLRSAEVATRLMMITAPPVWGMRALSQFIHHAPLLPPPLSQLQWVMKTVDEAVWEVIHDRQEHPTDADDLLNLLLGTRDGEGEALPLQRVRDEVTTFMLAGHETTANAMAWMWYLLALNTDARDRMLAEIDAVLDGRAPTIEDLAKLPWTTACFQESMRFYPPAWLIPRTAIVDDEIDGHRIPKGSTVLIPIHAIHHDERFWPDPEVYDPERFMGDAPKGRHRSAYLPFGGGRRICIGTSFALMETTLITAMMSQRFVFDLVPGPPGRARGDTDAAAPQRRQDDRQASQQRHDTNHHENQGGSMSTTIQPDHEVVVIGAGFAGIGTAIRLKDAGIEYRVIEEADDVGGTWHWNTYPGVAVDIPSFSYQFSFERRTDWSRVYAPGTELRGYALDLVEKYGLREHIRFGTRVLGLTFDEDAHLWRLETSDGDERDRALRHRRDRGADDPQAAGDRRTRRVRGRDGPHRPVGPRPRPARQARRRHRHRRLRGPAHPRGRAGGRAPHGLPAHADLVPAQARRADARRGALADEEGARRRPRGARGEPGVRGGHLPAGGALLGRRPVRQARRASSRARRCRTSRTRRSGRS